MYIYHGSQIIVKNPEIRMSKYTKDFSWGFYCTVLESQATKWAIRHKTDGFVNVFEYVPNKDLKIKKFDEVNSEWLRFIANCRNGDGHEYDVVEGPMADDTIYNYVEQYLDGTMSEEEFLILAKFKHPTHQISFHSIASLNCLTFIEERRVKYG